MAPQVKKAKTAFLYYQSDQLSAIRNQLKLSMGDAMSEVSIVSSVYLCNQEMDFSHTVVFDKLSLFLALRTLENHVRAR